MRIKEVKYKRSGGEKCFFFLKKREIKRQVLKMIPGQSDIQMEVFIIDKPETHPLGGFF